MLYKEKKFLKKIQLKNRQRVINKKYNEEGLTDDVLDAQIEVNQLRHQLDIPDSNNKTYDKFVQ